MIAEPGCRVILYHSVEKGVLVIEVLIIVVLNVYRKEGTELPVRVVSLLFIVENQKT
jgi:hypothetical protein